VLRSVGGYLTIGNDFEAEYYLLDTPSGSGEQIDDTVYLKNSVKSKIDYNDVKSGVILSNPHVPKITGEEAVNRSYNNVARYLHDVENVEEIEHCLDDIDNRADEILSIKTNRKRIYDFDVATKLIDSKIGDDITLDSANMKITNITKDGTKISVSADDLGDL